MVNLILYISFHSKKENTLQLQTTEGVEKRIVEGIPKAPSPLKMTFKNGINKS